ncbi:MAG: hypothetical protein K2J79_00070 [Ruminiclostridium sp.]|nr:hypothetical protein [Ruminiclostridium sp.]
MTRKNLSDAFGEIDDKLFVLAEKESPEGSASKSSDNVQSPIFIKNIRESKVRKRRKALISATAGIAACAVLAVSLPVLFNNTAPPYGAAETTEALAQQPAAAETDGQTEQTQAETQPVTPETQPVTAETPQEPTQIELYTKIKEILNAEEVYKVEKTPIDLSGFEANGLDDNGALWSIFSNRSVNGSMLIDGSSFFYTLVGNGRFPDEPVDDSAERYGHIFLYDMDTGEHSLIFKERAYKEDNGLLLKPMNYVDGWLYYYRMEIYPTEGDYHNDGTELWRVNINTKVKEKITNINTAFYLEMEAGIRSGKYLYFTDFLYTIDCVEQTNAWILRYDTEEGKLDIFKEEDISGGKGKFPFVYGYKNGIIYSIDGISFYFHTDDGEPDKFLPDLSSYNQDAKNYFQTIGNSGLIYRRDIPTPFEYNLDSFGAVIGILDEDFKARDLAYFPWYADLVNLNTDLELKLILTGEMHFDDTLFIYDMEADCFSRLNLQSEEDNAVYFTAQGDELRILVYSGKANECNGMTLYTIKK